ncbi:Ig-like domain-containing protein [Streptantibioticus parmotrematis]|uniref:L,D-transpeptidase n=1 Tax=Streptantibioticus parmotrematis TaxID=2873249 RepID=UPI0033F476A7
MWARARARGVQTVKRIGTAVAGARRGLLAGAVGAVLLLATACGGHSADAGTGGSGGSAAKTSQAVVTVLPRDGATDVATSGALKVTAAHGRLTQVEVKDGKGTEVPGKVTPDGTGWTPDSHLAVSTKYTVDAIAKDDQGRQSARHATFTTVVPKDSFIGFFTPDDGTTVGVGTEVSLSFNRPVKDTEAVEDGIKVTASPSVPVVGHWFGNQRIDFRPENYWAPGTKVTLSLRLDGVQSAPGVYGSQSKDVHFTIGRNQVSYVDASSHEMKVTQNGQTIKTIPISAGSPEHTTYNGKMVISEKDPITRMNGSTVGFGGEYDIPDVPHAMRLTQSGTFIHGNYWGADSVFGSENTSHGCVGLRDEKGGGENGTPAAWFYDHSLVGDVVVVSNSHDTLVAPDNGFNGWNMPWSQWTAGQ